MNHALIFDCDGVLCDTERDGHRVAFNQLFQERGLPVQWAVEEYGGLLDIGGGKERMATLLTPEFCAENDLPADRDAQGSLLADWHARKSVIYREIVRGGRLPARPGVSRIIDEALADGWELAVASTSAEESVRAVLEHVVASDSARFSAVVAGDVVANKKPAPDIYLLAQSRLRAPTERTVVIEDMPIGLRAAREARLACVVTLSTYSGLEGLDDAALVVSSLGDPGGETTRLIAGPPRTCLEGFVTLDDLLRAMPA